ncbi:hypothetical protein DYB28_008080 [Aphanomyces astaci]|uniref:Uncharacterized protein n=1 Tax=Aphanomyces astaci TaxID=112090 RepID=A0A9X8H7V7_APHAT|nr:hypothetical protein DYB28_008080 [Aphanomyces astaci]
MHEAAPVQVQQCDNDLGSALLGKCFGEATLMAPQRLIHWLTGKDVHDKVCRVVDVERSLQDATKGSLLHI